MTPEEVEARLRLLQTPAPPERLRERCLTARPRIARPRAAFALAASFLVIALAVWLLTMSGPKTKETTLLVRDLQKLPDQERKTTDPVLKDKVDRLLRENPGKGVLVIRVKELQDGSFLPVTHGFSLKILLEDAREVPDPLLSPGGPSASVDLDGTLLFVKSPGVYRGAGFSDEADERLKKLCFTWEYKDVALNPGGVLYLSDALFAPWLRWTFPAQGGTVSMREDPRISWEPYPEIAELRIEIQRVQQLPDGSLSTSGLGELRRKVPKEAGLPLSEILNALRSPVAAGTRLALDFLGCDARGRILTRCREKLDFVLRE
jgi:hypothetical protein